MSDDDLRYPERYWREKLLRSELDDRDQHLIEDQLKLPLFGYRKSEEYIVGCRVLYVEDGYADLLLMRRDFAKGGYLFDLDATLRRITLNESEELRQQVRGTIGTLTAGRGSAGERTVAAPHDLKVRTNYWLQMSGDQASNEAFLMRLRLLPAVEAQTRFITASDDGLVQIAVWSSEYLEAEFGSLASETGTSIVRIIRRK